MATKFFICASLSLERILRYLSDVLSPYNALVPLRSFALGAEATKDRIRSDSAVLRPPARPHGPPNAFS